MKMKKQQYLYDLGLINEFASNIGKYNYLNTKVLSDNIQNAKEFKNFFENKFKEYELNNTSLRCAYSYLYKTEIENSEYKDSFFDLFDFTLFKGFYQGISSIQSFIDSIGGKNCIKEVLYFQANFADPVQANSSSNLTKKFYKDLLKFFFNHDLTESEYKKYTAKGRFLNADFIIAIRDTNNNLRLLVIDNKIDLNFLLNHTNKEMGAILALSSLVSSKSRKVQFKNLNTYTESFKLDYDISSALMEYADIVNDKNILKMVQAGAYASSFINFLDNLDVLDTFNNKYVSIGGDVDTDISIMNLSLDKDLAILSKMRDAYDSFSRDSKKTDKLSTIKRVSEQLINDLEGDFKKENKEEFNKFLNLNKNDNIYICLNETLNNHMPTTANNPNMQTQNGDLFKKFMDSEDEVLCFLAGCPGIGKTFSFRECNKNLKQELSLYFSPRNAINEDFTQSYMVEINDIVPRRILDDDSRIILTASGTDGISENGEPVKVVNYITNIDDNLPSKDITTLHFRKTGNNYTFEDSKSEFKVDEANSKITYKQGKKAGVINRIVEGINDCIYKADNLNKINAVLTIQSQKRTFTGNTAKRFKDIFSKVVVENFLGEKTVNEEEFDKFAKLCPNIFIMIDEITGSPEGVQLFLDIYDVFVTDFYNLLNDKQKKDIKLKIIVADASLPNKDIMEKHLFNSDTIEQDKIYFSSITDIPPKEAYTEYLEVEHKGRSIKGVVINANAYPAKDLNLKHHIYSKSYNIESSKSLAKEELFIRAEKRKQDEKINKDIIKNAIEDVTVRNLPQTIIFVQDKNRISNLVQELNTQWNELYSLTNQSSLKEGINYLILDAELSDKDRSKHICTVNSKINSTRSKSDGTNYDNELKFVFITSTASRGISFKVCESMHIVLQNFGIESYLMELIQCIYRPRGDRDFDANAVKYLNFYQSQLIVSNEDLNKIYIDESKNEDISDFEYKKNQAMLSVMSYITLLRGTINTRIKGYTTISGANYSLVPVGGKYVNNASSSLLEEISSYIKLLDKEIRRVNQSPTLPQNLKKSSIECLTKIILLLRESFNSLKVYSYDAICKNGLEFKDSYKKFISNWNDPTLKNVIYSDIFHDYKFINGLFVFPAKNIDDELYFMSNLRKKREELYLYLELISKMPDKSKSFDKSTLYIRDLIKTELNRLDDDSIGYVEANNRANRYIAIPASALYDYNNIIKYDYNNQYPSFDKETGYKKDDEDIFNVLNILKASIDQYSSSRDVLPIISDFTDSVPFITFKSDNLESLHKNMFNKNYLISSTETNIFNLIMLSNLD